uniref:Uncharacterized protein n=1 Tax=Timema cristinae TaxID=61476 RepID=A0A7R9DNG8_TIMCR|nr:unnamed protein product [Timema cristinae]
MNLFDNTDRDSKVRTAQGRLLFLHVIQEWQGPCVCRICRVVIQEWQDPCVCRVCRVVIQEWQGPCVCRVSHVAIQERQGPCVWRVCHAAIQEWQGPCVCRDISGSYPLSSQTSGRPQPVAMPRHSISSTEEVISLDSDVPVRTGMEGSKSCSKKPADCKPGKFTVDTKQT